MRSLLFVFVVALAALSEAAKPKILVYRGPGGCNSCAAAAASSLLNNTKYEIEYISPSEVDENVFKNAILWIQPAGNGITAAKALGDKKLALIRNFVRSGGNYMGFCAGMFLTDKWVDNENTVPGLGLLPFGTLDYKVDDKKNINMTWINWNGKRRHIFFNNGGTFDLPADHNVEIIATYEADNKPATIRTQFGKGRVVLSGAHPEAPETWRKNNNVTDDDGMDLDLANEMLEWAVQ